MVFGPMLLNNSLPVGRNNAPAKQTEPPTTDRLLSHSERKNEAKRALVHFIFTNERLKPYRRIPEDQLYKLFIDANRWNPTAAASSDDPDLIFDRKEPGYMAAMMEAFIWMHETHDPLNSDFIVNLHDRAIREVGTLQHGHVEAFRTGYRTVSERTNESFRVVPGETVSEVGLKELIRRRKDEKYFIPGEEGEENILKTAMLDPTRTISFDPPTATSVTKKGVLSAIPIPSFSPQDLDRASDKILAKQTLASRRELSEENVDENKENNAKSSSQANDKLLALEAQVAREIGIYRQQMRAYRDPRIILRPPGYPRFLADSVEHLLKMYHQADLSDEEKKLRAAARLIQDLDQLHPFYDGNIRTYAVLLLSKLLIDNGLEPCCFVDPNCLDGLSEDELVNKIREGQKQFRSLQGS